MSFCSRIVLVLDSSGSMASQKNDIIGGVNEMIRQQRRTQPHLNNRVRFNLVKFNTSVEHPTNTTLANIPFLGPNDYITSGTTALYDAMGFTMERYKNEKNVIMIVATDGQENASKHYNYRHVTDMVRNCRNTLNWNFIYLSEDLYCFRL